MKEAAEKIRIELGENKQHSKRYCNANYSYKFRKYVIGNQKKTFSALL